MTPFVTLGVTGVTLILVAVLAMTTRPATPLWMGFTRVTFWPGVALAMAALAMAVGAACDFWGLT